MPPPPPVLYRLDESDIAVYKELIDGIVDTGGAGFALLAGSYEGRPCAIVAAYAGPELRDGDTVARADVEPVAILLSPADLDRLTDAHGQTWGRP